MTKARDIADFKFENIVDIGTEGTKVASGTSAQRGSTTGQWRFNTTTGFFEGRNNIGSFSTLEPTPTISSVDVTEVDSQAGGNQTFVITGTNFSSGGTVAFVGSSAEFNAASTTFDSATQVTAVAPKASFLNAQEPYKIKFTSASGVAGQSSLGLINVDSAPTWTTSAGQVGGEIYEGDTVNTTLVATDSDGDTITYTDTTGNLTSNSLSLNSSTGVIGGTAPAVSSDTTISFTARATANSKTADRSFNIIIKDNPLQGVSEFSAMNYEGTSNWLATLSASNNLREVTTASTIDTVAGTDWTGTKLIKLNDGGNGGDWTNIVSTIPSSGGWSLTFWGRCDASSDDTLSGTTNNQYARSVDFYSHNSEWHDFNNISTPSSVYFGSTHFPSTGATPNMMTGTSSFDIKVWRFYAMRYSISPRSTSSQTMTLTTSHNGSLFHNTSGSYSISTTSSNSGFMTYAPQHSSSHGINTYAWEGWTGGWRAFNTNLTDAQVSYLYNSGKGRF